MATIRRILGIKTQDEARAEVAHQPHVEEARKQAIAFMVPGVILQPSGVFAALHAQDAGCKYLRAS